MLVPYAVITFKNLKTGKKYILNNPVSVEIEGTWERLTDTCVIRMGRLQEWQGKPVAGGTTSVLERGMTVSVSLGFDMGKDSAAKQEFAGYIAGVKVDEILEIRCEDPMWLLKQKLFKKKYSSKATLSLKQLLTDLLKGTKIEWKANIDVPDLGNFDLDGNPNVAEVLDLLRTKYYIHSFFRNGVLQVGEPYNTGLGKAYTLPMNRFMERGSKLEYIKKEDHLVKVVVYAGDRPKLEAVAKGSDEEGALTRIPSYLTTKDALQTQANRMIADYKWEGLTGEFNMPGEPQVRYGDTVALKDDIYPDRSGTFRVKKHQVHYSAEGYFRTIHPHHKLKSK
jgi:hypothetical protein